MGVSDVDWNILMKKLDSFEQRLRQLESEIKSLQPKHFPYQSDNPNAPYYRPIYTAYALSLGSLSDAGLPQTWKLSTTEDDVEE